ncbi:MAG: glutathionylspermidine synthase family protein [Alphaproteobacteria bacterium]|nr:glutathionylspermidine synthase family protein [Alphaproteobacteria bacterium]PHY00446.1 MAG: glutathionylspermidine synthase [Rhodospirillaceae bacterium]
MHRDVLAPREHWQAKVEKIGFDWHTSLTDKGEKLEYWDENACWVLSPDEVDLIEAATNDVHQMCLQAVDYVVTKGLYEAIGYPDSVADLVENSWRRHQADEKPIYGRFDFAFPGLNDGEVTPKLLEYNADTPTGLFEASVVQWHWLQDCHPDGDQFNSIHEALVAAWSDLAKASAGPYVLHLTSFAPHPEDEGTVRYMQDVAIEAGFATKMIAAADIGWSSPEDDAAGESYFVDLAGEKISSLYKLLPWDWVLSDPFGDQMAKAVMGGSLRVIEPAWKLVLSSKGILPVLWKLFPDHPYLLESHFETAQFKSGSDVFAKPKLGREGANISLATLGAKGQVVGAPHASVDGPYGREGYIYQAAAPMARAEGRTLSGQSCTHHAVIGSWVIGDQSCGIGLREDTSLITQNTSRFVPHRMG